MRALFISRRGISLIEVLVSMFVLSMGLLGVAALIPLGQYTVSETSKSDRAGACARAAKREIATRRLLQPFQGPSYDNTQWMNSTGGGADYSQGMSYCIDPLLIARASLVDRNSLTNLMSFPALNMIPGVNRSNPLSRASGNILMQRVTYRGVVINSSGSVRDAIMPYSAAERVFVWQDDLLFDFPTDRGLRPHPIVTYNDNFSTLYPAGGNRLPYLRNADQNYSWMVTMSPAPTEANTANMGDRRTYNVSVVVFYKRRLDAPSVDEEAPNERVLEVSSYQLGRGLGGGGLTLRANRNASGGTAAIRDAFAWLDFELNDWLLLCGRYSNGDRYFEWYKIVSAAPAPTGNNNDARRQVAVIGPDWEHTSGATLRAVLVSDVLNVYTTTMELNLSSLWAK